MDAKNHWLEQEIKDIVRCTKRKHKRDQITDTFQIMFIASLVFFCSIFIGFDSTQISYTSDKYKEYC